MFERLFKRKPDAAMVWQSDGDDVIITCQLGSQPLPVDRWATAVPSLKRYLPDVLARLEEAGADCLGTDRIRLTAAQIAAMDGAEAAVLGLPAATAFALDLHPVDRIDQDSFRIRMRWVRPGGQPVRTIRHGAILDSEVGPRRVPFPLFQLAETAAPLGRAMERTERLAALAELQLAWPDQPGIALESDVYLRDLRVHHASGVSLKLRTLMPEHTEFDPVLFNAKDVAAESDEGGEALDEDVDNILAPPAQRLFAQDRFRREAGIRPVYVLRDGEYVFIDPALRPVLEQIRQVQDAPEDQRREFVLNPRRILRERLGDEMAEAVGLDARFIDTEQFSARVAGVDVWRTPVLPWLTAAQDNSWLPERFGLRVGEDYFAVPAANVRQVIERVENSAGAGHPTADVTGLLEPATPDGLAPPDMLPTNDQCRAALGSLAPFAVGGAKDVGADGIDDSNAWDIARGKLFLVVRDNFEAVDYAPFDTPEGVQLPEPEVVQPPKALRTQLKPHQVEGVS